ncbi:MAG: hypothetical protein ACLQVD_12845 [Capsulimonadaceae bacterium]
MASTFDTNALTLSEYAMQSNDPLVQKITFSLHKTMNVVQDIPLLTRKTHIQNGVRFVDNLPGVNWSPLNTPPTITRGKPTPYQEQMYVVRNQFQIDAKFIGEQNAITNPLDIQIEAWMEAFAFDFNYKFINNAHDAAADHDQNAPVGLRARLDNPTAFGVQAEMKIPAGGVDISPSGLTQETANTFIASVQQVLDYMNSPDGDGVVLYMNDYLKRRFEACVRQMGAGGGFAMTKDAFDRGVSKYKEATIRDVGRRVDQVTRVILPTEDINGLDNPNFTYTSLYAVRYGTDAFCGWQWEPLKPKNLGLDPTNGVAYNTVVDWGVGLWQPHTRAVGRLYGIKIA